MEARFKTSKRHVTDEVDVQLVVRQLDPSEPAVGVSVNCPRLRPVMATASCAEAGILLVT